MKFGELTQVAQCTVETTRYYKKEGLLPAPARTPGNFRVYGHEHIERLRFIRNCRALDMRHGKIHTLLGMVDHAEQGCGAVSEFFDQHIAHVDERMREFPHLKLQWATLGQRCRSQRAVQSCSILQGMATMNAEPKTQRHIHLGGTR
jgi:Cd(II)/Pb(II)-responsive transcriptional regulator